MRLHPVDLTIIVAYLAGVVLLGWYFSRKQNDLRGYFLSDHDVPWWALAASIVATETSVVTFISVPAFAYAANARGEGGNFTFLQLAAGYMVGRVVIVALFIPLYFRGELFTVYQILDRRFGKAGRGFAVYHHSFFVGRRAVVCYGDPAGGADRLGRLEIDSGDWRSDDRLYLSWRDNRGDLDRSNPVDNLQRRRDSRGASAPQPDTRRVERSGFSRRRRGKVSIA